MKTEQIKQKLHRYIETTNEKKLKAIYTMVEEEIEETSDLWDDEEFVAELERREKEYLKGITKTYSLEEAEARARQAVKKLKAK
jgi:hypothetical protein